MKKKVLLIDDDKEISELVHIILGENYNIESNSDAVGLQAKVTTFAPDLILLDNTVGQKQASEIIGELQNEVGENLVPIVLFSAHTDIARIATDIHADAYLSKPFNLHELYSCIDRLTA